MTVEQFFSLFIIELKTNKSLWSYYKFSHADDRFIFRKAYFCQRLQYIADHVGDNTQQKIWDCGCGYGTTALFLAMNGYAVHGSTLEFYFLQIEERKKYWAVYGDVALFNCQYENLFDVSYQQYFDIIIVQDTLHHIEPVMVGLKALSQSLNREGKLLVVEENGANIIQTIKLFWQRGFKKKLMLYDERLQKNILLGNENIRSISQWQSLFTKANLVIKKSSIHYIRLFLPFFIKSKTESALIAKEQRLALTSAWLTTYFYFGLNFIAFKNKDE